MIEHNFLLPTFLLFCAVIYVPSCLGCCGIGTRQVISYKLYLNSSQPLLDPRNEWTTSMSMFKPTTTTVTTATSSAISSTSSATNPGGTVASTTLTTSTTSTSPEPTIVHDNCSESETSHRGCEHGVCYVLDVRSGGVSRERALLCECDPYFSGETCDTPKTDSEMSQTAPIMVGKIVTSALVTGITVLVACLVLGAVLVLIYCSSYVYLQRCRKNNKTSFSAGASGGESASVPVEQEEGAAIRRRKYLQPESSSSRVSESVELQQLGRSTTLSSTRTSEGGGGAYHRTVNSTNDYSPVSLGSTTDQRALISAHAYGAHLGSSTSPSLVGGTFFVTATSANSNNSNNVNTSNNIEHVPVGSSQLYTLV